ncbi:uncharacterized protein B0T15DRAFT_47970 [Chaetomium strumarium]|uniref:Uncharacterized protein n=1 Tax=Chaetomium strumarium TaxID=1170767 RepID=A0AAJ0M6C9_9PEZI|nr:hypothetical protein B0T15DRAFT_47970 [Chaetomium strumarium]
MSGYIAPLARLLHRAEASDYGSNALLIFGLCLEAHPRRSGPAKQNKNGLANVTACTLPASRVSSEMGGVLVVRQLPLRGVFLGSAWKREVTRVLATRFDTFHCPLLDPRKRPAHGFLTDQLRFQPCTVAVVSDAELIWPTGASSRVSLSHNSPVVSSLIKTTIHGGTGQECKQHS